MNWKIYTEKGLRYILANYPDKDVQELCKAEIRRRKLKLALDYYPFTRPWDGYEKDR